tara:strand:+ start:304 stop:579 length:276 start_codon:yes stop_codon:yes gene_type:complete
MKITKSRLKQIIKEALATIFEEMEVEEFAKSKGWTLAQLQNRAKMTGISVEDLVQRYLQPKKSTRRGLAGLTGAEPLKHVEKSVVVTGTKG